MSDESTVVADLGKPGIAAMVAAFYRLVKNDEILGPMYPADDWDGSEERLREFLWFRLAQDPTYLLKRGHPRLRMRHMPFRIDIAARDRWLHLMSRAMDETGVHGTSRQWLEQFFFQIADFMRNQEESGQEK
ncbi:MAG: globin [Akkermansiaceae bacterium]